MIVKTKTGTVYELRHWSHDVASFADNTETLDAGWEARRTNPERELHIPFEDWTEVKLFTAPEVGLSWVIQFKGHARWNTSPVTWIEITDKEREVLHV